MLSDRTNLLYFHFASPVVAEFERLNSCFQATDVNPEEMIKTLILHCKSLKNRLFDRCGGPLGLDSIDFGAKFNYEIDYFIQSKIRSKPDELMNQVHGIKQRCAEMLREALNQVEMRLPESQSIFNGLSYLSPNYVLSQTLRVNLNKLPLQHLIKSDDGVIEEQYRKIIHVPWQEESTFEGNIPRDPVQFWSGVLKFKNSVGKAPFRDLAIYALTCFSSPVSNAVVERVFSTIANVKTKVRNRMGHEMLDSIVRVRTNLQFQENANCCKDFHVTHGMKQRFTTENMYMDSQENVEHMDETDELTVLKYL